MNLKAIAFRLKVVLVTVVIIAAVVIGALAYLYGVPKEVENVRIGNLISLTGALAAYGQPAAWAFRKCVEDVNKLGGLNVGGRKLQVKLIQYDDSSDPSKAKLLAEQLILQDEVHALLTSGGPPTISIPVSSIADKYKVPALVDGIFEVWWASGPYEYAWASSPVIITPIPEGDFRAGKPDIL
jgi:ABC-type branched-subunit amino acid transport system substrate-binding protein